MKRLLSVSALLAVIALALSAPARAICFNGSLTLCFESCKTRYSRCPIPNTQEACAEDWHSCDETCIDENCPDGNFPVY